MERVIEFPSTPPKPLFTLDQKRGGDGVVYIGFTPGDVFGGRSHRFPITSDEALELASALIEMAGEPAVAGEPQVPEEPDPVPQNILVVLNDTEDYVDAILRFESEELMEAAAKSFKDLGRTICKEYDAPLVTGVGDRLSTPVVEAVTVTYEDGESYTFPDDEEAA